MQACFFKIGNCIKSMEIKPIENFKNLHEFMRIMKFFKEHYKEEEPTIITWFSFHFACKLRMRAEEIVFGTGGNLLEGLSNLMSTFKELEHLSLSNLLLEAYDAMYIIDEICYNCCLTLKSLHLINLTKYPYQLLHVTVFLNLKELLVGPQSLGEDVVVLLSYTKLEKLFIFTNEFTENAIPVPYQAWKECVQRNPKLEVHYRLEGNQKQDHIWQERAPTKSIIYISPYIKVRKLKTLYYLYSKIFHKCYKSKHKWESLNWL